MKFRVERDVFADAVTWAARTLPQRPPVQVLAGLRLEATDAGTLTFASFDYQTSARCEIEAEIDEPGVILVQGRLLSSIVKSLPARPVEIELIGNQAHLTCGSARFSLGLMPVEEYPPLPDMATAAGKVDAGEFARAVAQTTMAASKDDTLPILMSVRMEIDGEKVTLLATDRYRLAMREFTWVPSDPAIEGAALIDARSLSDVAKSLTTAGNIDIALDGDGGKLIGFHAGGRQTTSNLVDGTYPPVRQLFPAEIESYAVINRAEFAEAVKRVSLVAERNTSVRLTFTGETLVLEAGQGEDAQASETIAAYYTGEEIQTAYNPHFLESGLAVINSDFVRMSFTAPAKPAVMSEQEELEGEDNDSFRYLLMPIRFSN